MLVPAPHCIELLKSKPFYLIVLSNPEYPHVAVTCGLHLRPSRCQIGPRPFGYAGKNSNISILVMRIRINEKALDIADLSAQYSAYENIIRLSLISEGKPRYMARIFESLIHEIIHSIDGLYLRELEERQVGALASGLTQAFLSLGI